MKYIVLFITVLVCNISNAKELDMNVLSPDSVVADPGLGANSLVFFQFPNAGNQPGTKISYSLDDKTGSHLLVNENKMLQLETTAGYHNMQFFFTQDYHEIYTSIDIVAGKRYYYSVYFEQSEVIIMTEKPVIYLYPEEETEINVAVEPKGEFTFTYPEYNDGWTVKASPNGNLKVNDQDYNYLFWEASEQLNPNEINSNLGFVVAGKNITEFLEEKLTFAGLNGKERADFITFWGPRMAAHSDVFLQFHFNKECDRFGKLDITPKPDAVYRIYVVWQPVDQLRIAPKPQEIPIMDRSGFTVLEWGGQELPSSFNSTSL